MINLSPYYYMALFVAAVFFYTFCLFMTYQKRGLHSAATLGFYFTSMFIWCLGSLPEVLGPLEKLAPVLYKLGVLGFISFCPLWIIFMIQNGKKRRIERPKDTILWIGIPFCIFLFLWLFPDSYAAFGSYFLFAACGVVYVVRFVLLLCKSGEMAVKKAWLCFLSFSISFCTMVLNFMNILPAILVPAAFSLSCICLLMESKNTLFEDLPPTTGVVFQYADQGVLLMNKCGKVMYANSKAFSIFNIMEKGWTGFQRLSEHIAERGFGSIAYSYRLEMDKRLGASGTVLFIQEKLEAVPDIFPGIEDFTQKIDELIGTAKSGGSEKQSYAIAYVDIDNFTSINRTVGRHHADMLLRILARRLADATGNIGDVCRIRSDEFLVIFRIGEDSKINAEIINKRIQFATEVPFIIMDDEVNISTSVGIGFIDQNTPAAEGFIAILHTAAQSLSEKGGNGYTLVTEEFKEKTAFESILRRDLGRAAERGELQLLYQPQVSAEGRVFGFEVLVRWNHPTQGVIPPGVFIPLAEESGEIGRIGKWVLEEAIKEWAKQCWSYPKLKDMKLAVNVCVVQLSEFNFAKNVIAIIEKYGLQPHQLHLEMTESMTLYDDKRIFENLNALDQKGVALAIDDFGMGYTSLRYIKMLPVSTIKLDGMFSCDVLTSSTTVMIIETMALLCRQIGMEMIVEHVETKEQFEMLKSLGCTRFQGYYFSKPVLPARIKDFVN